jgi:hypothetical protein
VGKEIPKPASPLPWKFVQQEAFDTLEDGSGPATFGVEAADGHQVNPWGIDEDNDREPDFTDAGYIVWAANTAPALAARVAGLEQLLRRAAPEIATLCAVNVPVTGNDPWHKSMQKLRDDIGAALKGGGSNG